MMNRKLILPCILVVTLAACTGRATEVHGINTAPEPTSLDDLGGLGGSTWLPWDPEEIAVNSQLVVEALVVDVRKSHMNTEDGLFPSADAIAKFWDQGRANVLTDVDVRIVRVLEGAEAAPSLVPDDTFTITFVGGSFETTLDAEQAQEMGVKTVVEVIPGENGSSDSEIEEPANGPVSITYGTAPSEHLAEGETVIMFLTRFPVPSFDGANEMTIWSSTHPAGIYRRTAAGAWASSTSEISDEEMNRLTGLLTN